MIARDFNDLDNRLNYLIEVHKDIKGRLKLSLARNSFTIRATKERKILRVALAGVEQRFIEVTSYVNISIVEELLNSRRRAVSSSKMKQQIAYFKRHQSDQTYHYYKVVGGPGKTENGYQEVLNFLNPKPIIHIEHNDTSGLTGTWCQYEVGISITKEEYDQAFKIATKEEFDIL